MALSREADPHTRSLVEALRKEGLIDGSGGNSLEYYHTELESRMPHFHDVHDTRHSLVRPPHGDHTYGTEYLTNLDETHRQLREDRHVYAMKPNVGLLDGPEVRPRSAAQWYRYHEWLLRPSSQLPKEDKDSLARHYDLFRTLYMVLCKDEYHGIPNTRHDHAPSGGWSDACASRRELLKRDFHLDWLLEDYGRRGSDHQPSLETDEHFEELYASLKAGKRPIVFQPNETFEQIQRNLWIEHHSHWENKSEAQKVLRHGNALGRHHEHIDSNDNHDSHERSAIHASRYPAPSTTGTAFFQSLLHQLDTYRKVEGPQSQGIMPRGLMVDKHDARWARNDDRPPFAGRDNPASNARGGLNVELYRCLEYLSESRYDSKKEQDVLEYYHHFRKLGEFLAYRDFRCGDFHPSGGWHAAAIYIARELRRKHGQTRDWLELDYALAEAIRGGTDSPRRWDKEHFARMRMVGPAECGYFHALHLKLQEKWRPSVGPKEDKFYSGFARWLVRTYGNEWGTSEHA